MNKFRSKKDVEMDREAGRDRQIDRTSHRTRVSVRNTIVVILGLKMIAGNSSPRTKASLKGDSSSPHNKKKEKR